jgi:hypothetical protein
MIPQLDRDGAFASAQSASSPDASLRAGNAGPGLGSGVIGHDNCLSGHGPLWWLRQGDLAHWAKRISFK